MVSLTVKLPTADGMQTWVFRTNFRIIYAAGINYNEAKNLVKRELASDEVLRESGRETIDVLVP